MMREEGLSDYLVLLSVYQTCKYRGVSFLKFLLSRERMSMPTANGSGRRPNHTPLRCYPPGFPRMYPIKRKGKEGESTATSGQP